MASRFDDRPLKPQSQKAESLPRPRFSSRLQVKKRGQGTSSAATSSAAANLVTQDFFWIVTGNPGQPETTKPKFSMCSKFFPSKSPPTKEGK